MSDIDEITQKAQQVADRLRGELDELEAELDAFDVQPGMKPPELQVLMQRVGDKRKEWRKAEALAQRRSTGFSVQVGPPPG